MNLGHLKKFIENNPHLPNSTILVRPDYDHSYTEISFVEEVKAELDKKGYNIGEYHECLEVAEGSSVITVINIS